jgi:hypothetical protein
VERVILINIPTKCPLLEVNAITCHNHLQIFRVTLNAGDWGISDDGTIDSNDGMTASDDDGSRSLLEELASL